MTFETVDDVFIPRNKIDEAVMKIFNNIGDDEFICPGLKGVNAVVTLEVCEGKALGRGCNEMLSCNSYQEAKKRLKK